MKVNFNIFKNNDCLKLQVNFSNDKSQVHEFTYPNADLKKNPIGRRTTKAYNEICSIINSYSKTNLVNSVSSKKIEGPNGIGRLFKLESSINDIELDIIKEVERKILQHRKLGNYFPHVSLREDQTKHG